MSSISPLKIVTCFIFFVAVCYTELYATHIRAGEIIAQRISASTLTYRFWVIGYTDTGSTVQFGGGELSFGDGISVNLTEAALGSETTILEDEIAKNVFWVDHTFQTPGRWLVSYNEQNRNQGVVNMSNSVDTPFYIETVINIDPILGSNNTVQFLIPPVDKGAEGATFLHNPGAFDPDGDSISYRLTIPKQFLDRDVNDHKWPNDASFYTNFSEGNQEGDGPPTFEIDPITGTLVWDAPGLMGEYNLAFIVEEWRKFNGEFQWIGSVIRDMQVIIEETDNNPPEITQPLELCVEAGTVIEEVLVATDPDGDDIIFEAFGGPLELANSPASYTPDPINVQSSPASINFTWNTNCLHVRERPYEVQLKAKDQPDLGPKLVDFKTWFITIVAPAPTGLTTNKLSGRRIELNWDPYTCGNADSIQIWRRVDNYEIVPEECVVGMPANAGYELIEVVNNNDLIGDQITSYLDDNEGIGLAPGALYCYRIVAQFPDPQGGESYVSNEACAQIGVEAPVILNVDVRETSDAEGEIFVRWEAPFDLDPVLFPGPYTYDVVRHDGANGLINPDTVSRKQSLLEYTDVGLDTRGMAYHYLINVYQSDGTYIDRSFPASSVRLDALADVQTISLNWNADVPWSNSFEDDPYHLIYRAIEVDDGFGDPLNFVLIDSVNVLQDGFRFVDDGSFGNMELSDELIYNYYVTTKGSYGNPDLAVYDPLINNSQIIPVQPNDTVPPCTPVGFQFDPSFDCENFMANQDCEFNNYSILLEWEEAGDSNCDNDISSYNIYFSLDSDENIPLVDNVVGLSYQHVSFFSFKGYFQIAAVDRSGNVSERSEILAIDNCPSIRMPNYFTPNGDGINDLFTPFYSGTTLESSGEGGAPIFVPEISGFSYADCPRFVVSLEFTVFDRTGKTLFNYKSTDFENQSLIGQGGEQEQTNPAILINWDGRSDSGLDLQPGVYYYGLEVIFDTLDPKDSKKTYKGWIQLDR